MYGDNSDELEEKDTYTKKMTRYVHCSETRCDDIYIHTYSEDI